MSFLNLVSQLIFEKENSEFKPAVIRFKMTLCVYEGRGWINTYNTLHLKPQYATPSR